MENDNLSSHNVEDDETLDHDIPDPEDEESEDDKNENNSVNIKYTVFPEVFPRLKDEHQIRPDKEDRIKGSLLGLAWGDAFGCPIEGWREPRIKMVFGFYTALPEAYPTNIFKEKKFSKYVIKRMRPLGLHSDDTQQSLALINCCLRQNKTWNAKEWGKWLSEGMKTKAFRGFGRNFSAAVGKLGKGVAPNEAGSSSSGIGAAMRIGPVGAIYRDDYDLLAKVAWEASLTTHATIMAASISYAIAFSVAELINGVPAEKIREALPSAVSKMEKEWTVGNELWKVEKSNYHLISETLRTIFTELDLSDRSALRLFISRNAKPHLGGNIFKSHVNQGFAGLGGIHGLVMALLPDIHPQQILSEIVSLGYDVDTVGAMCGTVFGARFGTSWIPKERLMDLQRLETYAEALVSLSSSHLEDMATYMQKEAELTSMEKEYRKEILAACGFSVGAALSQKAIKKMNKRQKKAAKKALKEQKNEKVITNENNNSDKPKPPQQQNKKKEKVKRSTAKDSSSEEEPAKEESESEEEQPKSYSNPFDVLDEDQ